MAIKITTYPFRVGRVRLQELSRAPAPSNAQDATLLVKEKSRLVTGYLLERRALPPDQSVIAL
jgi:hypothetical protein